MTGQILVALQRSDEAEEIVSYAEQIARPGMRVVFLVPSGLSTLDGWVDRLLVIHAGVPPAALPRRNSSAEIDREKRLSVERQVLPACETLKKRGVGVAVNVYDGSLRRIVRDYLQRENVYLVMMRSRMSWIEHYLSRFRPVARLFSSLTFAPVVLLHPGK